VHVQSTIAPTTKADAAYCALRRAIVTLEIEGGEPLDEADLGDRFGVGRTPLREALKRLALEQLVVAPPHRTPYVRSFDLTDLQPLFETRLLLEVTVAGVAAERATEADVASLQSNLADMARAVARADVYDTIEIDYAFHSLVARATKNRFLAEAINQLNRGSLRLWYLAHLKLGLHDVVSYHTDVVEALRGGQREVVEEVMRQHVLRSQSRVIKAFATGVEAAPNNGAVVAAWKGAER
jgi:DNA-binding GntR family transcriptional regulator